MSHSNIPSITYEYNGIQQKITTNNIITTATASMKVCKNLSLSNKDLHFMEALCKYY